MIESALFRQDSCSLLSYVDSMPASTPARNAILLLQLCSLVGPESSSSRGGRISVISGVVTPGVPNPKIQSNVGPPPDPPRSSLPSRQNGSQGWRRNVQWWESVLGRCSVPYTPAFLGSVKTAGLES
jgi:hypothetical protein